MRIDLPSGAWVEVKDNTVPRDRFAVQDATEVVVEDGRAVVGGTSRQWTAFLTRIVTGWSYQDLGVPIPSAGGSQVLDEYPQTDEDIDALNDALAERYERIVRSRRPNRSRPPSGASAPSPS